MKDKVNIIDVKRTPIGKFLGSSKKFELETNRLILREINLSDTKEIVEWRSNPKVYRYFKNPHKITDKEHINWYKNVYAVSGNMINWICIEKSSALKIGIFGINLLQNNRAEISYLLADKAQHKGYAKETILMLVEYAEKELGIKEVIAQVHIENVSSIKLVENIGCKKINFENNFITYSKNISNVILFRADANKNIGTGHVMRCLSIAKEFRKNNMDCIFITADHDGDILIKENDFETFCLNSVWNDLDIEIKKFLDVIEKYSPKAVIIDSYFVTEKYLLEITSNSYTIYIDDMNVKCWNIDVLINYNIFADIFDYSAYKGTKTKLLLGTEYVPLRDEFSNLPKHKIKENVTDILISAGGADPMQITEKIMTEICTQNELSNIKFHFVIGVLNPRIENIKKLQDNMKNVVLHINEKNISKLMCDCDIAISAAGSTLYELCACGIPTITYTLADNQIKAAQEFDKRGLMINAGDCRDCEIFIKNLKAILTDFVNKTVREEYSIKMQLLSNGRGASNITNYIFAENRIFNV